MRRSAVALVLALLAVPAGFFFARPDPLRPRPVTQFAGPMPKPVAVAVHRYEARGGEYVWGRNDCSVFVTDYLRGRRVPIGARLTTACLASPEISGRGLRHAKNPRPGDVLNYRYRSAKTGRWAGHCGVVVRQGRALWVMHNARGHGLVVQPLPGFLRRAEEVGVRSGAVQVLRPTRGA